MSLRVDSSSIIAGSLVCGDPGLGVLGSLVPSTGDNGAGYLYNDLSLPDDAAKEVRGLIVTPPSAGTFFAYEDSSFEFIAPDGAYSFTYRLFVDGADLGTATASLYVGEATVTITATNGAAAASGYQSTISQAATVTCAIGNAQAAGYTAAVEVGGATTIICSVGQAVAAGQLADIAANVAIGCAIGNAAAAGFTGTVSQNFTVIATTGQATAQGHAASIAGASAITCTIGVATATGLAGMVMASGVVTTAKPRLINTRSRTLTIDARAH